jgi:hypothetical protein
MRTIARCPKRRFIRRLRFKIGGDSRVRSQPVEGDDCGESENRDGGARIRRPNEVYTTHAQVSAEQDRLRHGCFGVQLALDLWATSFRNEDDFAQNQQTYRLLALKYMAPRD